MEKKNSMFCPDPAILAFNGAALQGLFQAGTPDADDPARPGYWIILRGGELLVLHEQGVPTLPFGPYGQVAAGIPQSEPPLRIGSWRNKPLRVIQVDADAPASEPWAAISTHFREPKLDDQLLTLAGLARQILHWKTHSANCPSCGLATQGIERTWGVRCAACDEEYFPSIHPAVIVLARRGEEFLLIRKAQWPKGMYGLIAGFLEFGESLEECAIREVKEEAGIDVCDIRYACSQSWPFPSQIMAGFTARYAGGEIVPDMSEIEDARWFSPTNMPPGLSPRNSISRYIIENFALKPHP